MEPVIPAVSHLPLALEGSAPQEAKEETALPPAPRGGPRAGVTVKVQGGLALGGPLGVGWEQPGRERCICAPGTYAHTCTVATLPQAILRWAREAGGRFGEGLAGRDHH